MCPFTQTNKHANTHKHTGYHVFSVFGLVVLPPQPLPNWKIRLDILLALVPVRTGCGWWDLTRVGVEVVSSWMSRLRLKGSFPWKWAIKTEGLFIFLLSLFLVCIWHGVESQAGCLGMMWGTGWNAPNGSPAHELNFINGNAASIIGFYYLFSKI